MRVVKDFSKFVIFSEDNLLNALNKINVNKSRVIFAVSEGGVLEGVLTDGDVRRWLTSTGSIDLNTPISAVMNRQFMAASVDVDPDQIRVSLERRVHQAIPLLDSNQRLVAVALFGAPLLEIEGRVVDDAAPTFVIAEIGNNHQGNLAMAHELIEKAAEAGADCAKFQMRDLKTLYKNGDNSNDVGADLGAQYTLDLLRRFQLSDEELFSAFDHCRQHGVIPLCTPWDHSSLEKLERYGLSGYKVASADFTNYGLIESIAATGKPMIISTGMSTEAEILDGVKQLQKLNATYALLHCNSTYPAPFKDVNLKYMCHLKEVSNTIIGYSGHERGISVAIAAVALGAKIIEKHFTLDKVLEGNDHKVSLLPHEFARMVEGIRQVEEALGSHEERRLSQGELMNRETLAKSLVAVIDIPAGTSIDETMITVQSPGQGLQPNRKKELLGKALSSDKKAGDFFFPSDLGEGGTQARNYSFPLQWGVPVRYHDLQHMCTQSNMDVLEIHLSYKDMDLDFKEFINEPLDKGLVVHAPELFAGDHTLDLCAEDESYRQRSVQEMQRVIDLTRRLVTYFRKAARPSIVTNVGGFSANGHLPVSALPALYKRLELSLSQLDVTGVEIIPQTMPPFPWHFGGQQFHNLFVDAESIVAFCQKNKMRVCLDVSHSKLACNHRQESFAEFTRRVMPYAAHLHLADAKGVDGEGLQIGDGDIDWKEFFNQIRSLNVYPSFIPEIWQGHKNGGEGAWKALALLESAAS